MLRFLVAFLTPPALAFGGGGGSPTPPPPPAPLPPPPMLQSPQGAQAADSVRKRAASGLGYGGTIVTGPRGLTAPANVDQKRLLGG